MSTPRPNAGEEKYSPSEQSEETVQDMQPFSRPPGPPPDKETSLVKEGG